MQVRYVAALVFCAITSVDAQIVQYPFLETFSGANVPTLPVDWLTSTNRTAGGDFTSTKSTPYSDSVAVISTNATIAQELISPIFDFTDREADSLKFFERRSSSHTSGVLIEASTDGGSSFTVAMSDTIFNPGTTAYVQRAYRLPAALNNQPDVRFRWRVIGNGSGTTGTLRYDNIGITARGQIDASVSAIYFSPAFPGTGDSVIVSATIANTGTRSFQAPLVGFFVDANGDSLPDPNELFESITLPLEMFPGDTAVAQATLRGVAVGNRIVIAQVGIAGDIDIYNNTRRATLSVGLVRQSVVVNEIMYAPSTGQPEWVELYNATPDSIDLRGWKLSNRNVATRYTITNSTLLLPSHAYVVVTKTADLFDSSYGVLSPPVVEVSAMPTFLFNNSGDAVVVFDVRGSQMDSVRYAPSWGGKNGASLERIESGGATNDSSNWSGSTDSSGSTPGRENSHTPVDDDLRGGTLHLEPADPPLLTLVVHNAGRRSATAFSASFFIDADADSIAEPEELLSTVDGSPLVSKDSVLITLPWNSQRSGRIAVIARIDYGADLRLSNNTVMANIDIPFEQSTLVINEIMYDPGNDGSEYVELFNRGTSPVDVNGWQLADMPDTTEKFVITDSSFVIPAAGYLVVANDPAIFQRFPYLADTAFRVIVIESGITLNNGGDEVVLLDITRRTIDSIHYSTTWHNPLVDETSGRSLEKINPDLPGRDTRNWSTSAGASGGTPGVGNSLYAVGAQGAAALSFSPNPFSPDGDGFEDVTIISYQSSSATAVIRARVFDAQGRLIRTLADGEPGGRRGDIVWNGLTDAGNRARIGIYIVLLESLDSMGGDVQAAKGVVVVATKL